MRGVLILSVLLPCAVLRAAEPANHLEQLTVAAQAARQKAAAEPVVRDRSSPPVIAYLAEQSRRRAVRLAGLKLRLADAERDASKAELAPVLKQQLADLESKPPEAVSFDMAYGYEPTTGLIGYSKKVRLLENTTDGKSVILVDSAALVIGGLGTRQYASDKFFGVEQAILVGAPRADYIFRGSPKKCYDATLVDLEKLLQEKP